MACHMNNRAEMRVAHFVGVACMAIVQYICASNVACRAICGDGAFIAHVRLIS